MVNEQHTPTVASFITCFGIDTTWGSDKIIMQLWIYPEILQHAWVNQRKNSWVIGKCVFSFQFSIFILIPIPLGEITTLILLTHFIENYDNPLVTRHELAARTLSQSRQYAVHGPVGLKYVVYATILKICRIMGRSFRYILKSLNPRPKIRSILQTL